MIDIKSFMIGAITCLCVLFYVYFGTDLLVKKVILNNDELERQANEKATRIIDSVRALPYDQRIEWVMSDN